MEDSSSEGRPSGILGVVPLTILIATLVSDQVTKGIIVLTMSPGQSMPNLGLFRLTYVTNSGSAFGFFPNQTTFLILASFVGIGVLLIFYRTHPVNSSLLKISLGLQLGGAIGNLIDRVRLGYVVDFIDVGAWPVFNLADSAIVVGLIGLLWTLVSARDAEPSASQTGEEILLPIVLMGEDVDENPSLAKRDDSERKEDTWEQSVS